MIRCATCRYDGMCIRQTHTMATVDDCDRYKEIPYGEWIKDIRSMICEVNDYYGYTDSMHMFKVLFDQKYHGWKEEGGEK